MILTVEPLPCRTITIQTGLQSRLLRHPLLHVRGGGGRRFLFLLLPLALYGALLAYDLWRPLSEAERRLVGTWLEVSTKTVPKTEMVFTADRRLDMTMIAPQGIRIVLGAGSWSVRGNNLRFRLDRRPEQTPATMRSWRDIPSILTRPFSRFSNSGSVVFQGDDRIDWGGVQYDRHPAPARTD